MLEGPRYTWLFLSRACLIYGGPGLSQCHREGHSPPGITALHIWVPCPQSRQLRPECSPQGKRAFGFISKFWSESSYSYQLFWRIDKRGNLIWKSIRIRRLFATWLVNQAHLLIGVWKACSPHLCYADTKHWNKNFAVPTQPFNLVITLPVLGLSHERSRRGGTEKTHCGRLWVCGREHEGETVITNSSPGQPEKCWLTNDHV